MLDEAFTQFLIIALSEKGKDSVYQCDSNLQAYWDGHSPKMGKSWKKMKVLYTVLWVHEDHWIAVKVDIEKCKLVVFDCNLQATPEGEIEAYMEPLHVMMPILLDQSGMLTKLSDKLKDLWPYKRLQNLPQNNK